MLNLVDVIREMLVAGITYLLKYLQIARDAFAQAGAVQHHKTRRPNLVCDIVAVQQIGLHVVSE